MSDSNDATIDRTTAQFGIASYTRPPVRPEAPRLIEDEQTRLALTQTRRWSAGDALVEALAEYLRCWSVNMRGREVRFVRVVAGWAVPETPAEYPAAAVTTPNEISLVTEGGGDELGTGMELAWIEGTQVGVSVTGSARTTLGIEVWANSRAERTALVALVEDALQPVEWSAGAHVAVPEYHNTRARFGLLGYTLEDSDSDDARRYYRAVFRVDAVIPSVRIRGRRDPQPVKALVEAGTGVVVRRTAR